ncbi:hypothetical protein Tco_0281042 [Tanacetum coccineum]
MVSPKVTPQLPKPEVNVEGKIVQAEVEINALAGRPFGAYDLGVTTPRALVYAGGMTSGDARSCVVRIDVLRFSWAPAWAFGFIMPPRMTTPSVGWATAAPRGGRTGGRTGRGGGRTRGRSSDQGNGRIDTIFGAAAGEECISICRFECMRTRSQSQNQNRPQQQSPPVVVEPFNFEEPFDMAANGAGSAGPPPAGGGGLPVPDLRTMEELCQPSLDGRGGPIAPIAIQATTFGLKNDMIQQV